MRLAAWPLIAEEWPTDGRAADAALQALQHALDYAVLQVLVLAAAVTFVVINLLVDIAYAVIDPRVRTR